MIGASYDRRIYGYQIETSREQDRRLIEILNQADNKSRFNLLFNNCANFAQKVMNLYYPHAVRRNFIVDAGLMTPKQAARSLVGYSKHHRDLKFTTFVIPQSAGSIHHSSPVDGIVESLVKSKKYLAPIAVFQPFVAGGLAVVYLVDGRFHPDNHAPVLDPAQMAVKTDIAENRQSVPTESEAGPANSGTHTATTP